MTRKGNTPRCQDAKMPRCQDAKMPRCQAALVSKQARGFYSISRGRKFPDFFFFFFFSSSTSNSTTALEFTGDHAHIAALSWLLPFGSLGPRRDNGRFDSPASPTPLVHTVALQDSKAGLHFNFLVSPAPYAIPMARIRPINGQIFFVESVWVRASEAEDVPKTAALLGFLGRGATMCYHLGAPLESWSGYI